jgi:hypothetical protein
MMTGDVDLDRASQGGGVLRLVTLVVGSVEIILFTLFVHLMLHSTDPLGESIGEGRTFLIAAPLVLLTLPGLLLAWLDKAPRAALSLVCLALPATALAWS